MKMENGITKKVKEFVKAEFEKPDACYKESFENHFVFVVRHALELAEKENADKEIVEIAAWLHDIGSIRGQYENHHIVSSEIAEDLLKKLGYPQEKIEQIKHCILSHRGSRNIKRETKEAQILADADALSHFDDIEGLITRVYKDKKKVLAKLERSFAKLSDNAKPLAKERMEAARKSLDQ